MKEPFLLSGLGLLGFESWLHTCKLSASDKYLPSLGLSFCVYQMKMVIMPGRQALLLDLIY